MVGRLLALPASSLHCPRLASARTQLSQSHREPQHAARFACCVCCALSQVSESVAMRATRFACCACCAFPWVSLPCTLTMQLCCPAP
jgi:hypothetical protein